MGNLVQAAPLAHSAPMASDAFYRPALHFTPEANWMNDPNGLFFDGSLYHVYYQHYPKASRWGPMHWGHATSEDLVQWQHHPIALAPDDNGFMFSGSVVVDTCNTSRLGSVDNPPVVALYTCDNPATSVQSQYLAYSLDGGYTFEKVDKPVLANPGLTDFRDPKVFRHDISGRWIMVLAEGHHIGLYGSPNLLDWTHLSSFGEGVGMHTGVWECPDLIPIVASDGVTKWVLVVSIGMGHPSGGSATQYFVGNFDGITFTPDESNPPVLWLDAGRDNYAGITFHQKGQAGSGDVPLFIGWMSNWMYCQQVPTRAWRSSMTLARDLGLQAIPASERISYRLKQWAHPTVFSTIPWTVLEHTDSYNIADHTELCVKWTGVGNIGLTFTSTSGDSLRFEVFGDGVKLDRRALQNSGFSNGFPSVETAKLHQQGQGQHLVIIDRASFEYFGEDGLTVLTDLFFVKQWFDRLTVQSSEGLQIVVHVR